MAPRGLFQVFEFPPKHLRSSTQKPQWQKVSTKCLCNLQTANQPTKQPNEQTNELIERSATKCRWWRRLCGETRGWTWIWDSHIPSSLQKATLLDSAPYLHKKRKARKANNWGKCIFSILLNNCWHEEIKRSKYRTINNAKVKMK